MLTGCVQDLVYSDVNRDTVDVLLRQWLRSHDAAGAALLRLAARAQRRAGPGAGNGAAEYRCVRRCDELDAIITNAGRLRLAPQALRRICCATIRATRQRAAMWSAKVRDIHEWLVEIGRAPQSTATPPTASVTYHEACHFATGRRSARSRARCCARFPACGSTNCRKRRGAAAARAFTTSRSRKCRENCCSAK